MFGGRRGRRKGWNHWAGGSGPCIEPGDSKGRRGAAWGSRVRAPQQRPTGLALMHPADLQPARAVAAAGSAQVKRGEWA